MSENLKLTCYAANCGCSAKLAPGLLTDVLACIESTNIDPSLMVGTRSRDDACVYKISDDVAMIQTLDFFTPIVDDPYSFGQIAAANALSDVFAMGADPKIALNILCIPHEMESSVVKEILMGGNDKVNEAGAMITGGHTIEDPIPKYGLSVTGFAHPLRVFQNSSAKEGDVLILTKPLGIGILNTAYKMGVADETTYGIAVDSMKMLNKTAKDIMIKFDIHACTDITGFGFLGHLLEMVQGSDLSAEISSDLLPIFPSALKFAKEQIFPSAVYKNKNYIKAEIDYRVKIPEAMEAVMLDPQTSGGLLIAVSPKDSQELLHQLKWSIPCAQIIGQITEKRAKSIFIS